MLWQLKDNPLLTWVETFLKEHPAAELYVVGGTIRDALRGRPSDDIDLMIAGMEAEPLGAWLEQHGTVSFVGTHFGVWKFAPHHNPDNPRIDIALPRTERSTGTHGGYRQFLVESNPHLPVEEDLSRRDFTINAIAYRWRTGEIIDPFDGQADLAAQIIRTVGDPATRFREDSSRLLRAIRFACALRFTIEPGTWQALTRMIPRLSLTHEGRRAVARELMAEEFVKTLVADPVRCTELSTSAHVWEHLELATPPPQLKDRFARMRSVDFQTRFGNVPPELLLALICHHLLSGPAQTQAWLHTWRMHMHADVRAIQTTVRLAHTDPDRPSLAQIERQLLPYRDLLFPFLYLKNDPQANRWLSRLLQTKKRTHLAPLVDGGDLSTLGIGEGPRMGELLDLIRSQQLEGMIENEQDVHALLESEGLGKR